MMEENNRDIQIINFAKQETPLPEEKIDKNLDKYTRWGRDNLYPNFILKLANESALHRGILSSKANFIYGDGLADKNGNTIPSIMVNGLDSLSDFVRKCLDDMLLFGGFSAEIGFNLLGEALTYTHIPFHLIRANKNKSKFTISEDWYANSKNLLSMDRYIIGGENEDMSSKVFYFTSYAPSINSVYPTPDYNGAISSIFTDILINEMFQHNVGNGFSVTKIVSTYSTGTAPAEQLKQATKNFKENFTGNGDNFILETLGLNDKPTTIQSVPVDDFSSKLVEVTNKTRSDIMTAHSVTSPVLFGIAAPNSLGNATELENAYQIFKDTFVKSFRLEFEAGLNKLFSTNNNIPYITFKDKTRLFKPVLDANLKGQIMTINEIREEQGLPKLVGGDVFVPVANKIPESSSRFSTCNHNFNKDYYLADEDDYEKIKDFGTMEDDFEIVEESDNNETFAEVEVWYRYSLRDGVTGTPIIPTTRYFCRKLLESGKLFSRIDIQKFTKALGYDVFEYCGGWYHNKETGETTPHCRHYWHPVKVIRKKKL